MKKIRWLLNSSITLSKITIEPLNNNEASSYLIADLKRSPFMVIAIADCIEPVPKLSFASNNKTLDALKFSNEIIAALDYQVSREGKAIDEVTKQWLSQQS